MKKYILILSILILPVCAHASIGDGDVANFYKTQQFTQQQKAKETPTYAKTPEPMQIASQTMQNDFPNHSKIPDTTFGDVPITTYAIQANTDDSIKLDEVSMKLEIGSFSRTVTKNEATEIKRVMQIIGDSMTSKDRLIDAVSAEREANQARNQKIAGIFIVTLSMILFFRIGKKYY